MVDWSDWLTVDVGSVGLIHRRVRWFWNLWYTPSFSSSYSVKCPDV